MDNLHQICLANRFLGKSDVLTHAHDFTELIFVTRGNLKMSANDKEIPGGVGDLFIIPPRLPHLQIDEEIVGTTYIGFICDESAFDVSFRKISLKNEFYIPKWMEDVVNIHSSLDKSEFYSKLKSTLTAAIIQKIDHFEQQSITIQSIHPKVQDALEILNNNFTKSISVPQIAKTLDISASHLTALFKKFTGHSPIRYQQKMRMELACKYLHDPYVTVKQVAYHCGYEDVNFFIRQFRKTFKITPGKWKEQFGNIKTQIQ